jgi:hypothetical protein
MKILYAVILVDSTSHAMRIERLLNTQHIRNKLIPVPRHLSSDCGVCVRIADDKREFVREMLKLNKIVYQSIEVL